MDLTIYDIILFPKISEKAYALNRNLKQLVLEVHPKANKPLISEALKKLFNVEVEQVRVIVSKGKTKRMKRRKYVEKTRKKAIVLLKEGFSADMLGFSGAESQVG